VSSKLKKGVITTLWTLVDLNDGLNLINAVFPKHNLVPLLTPVTLFVVTLGTIGTFQVVGQNWIMTSGGPVKTTTTLSYLIYLEGFQNFSMGYAAAIAVILFAIILVVFLIQNTQNRDAKAIHLKLDELIRSHQPARNDMIDIEKLSDEELEELEKRYAAICEEHKARQGRVPATPEEKKKQPAA